MDCAPGDRHAHGDQGRRGGRGCSRIPNGPLVAQVFKTRIDPFVQKLSFIRVFSGHVEARRQWCTASTARKPVKIGPLLRVQAAETEAV